MASPTVVNRTETPVTTASTACAPAYGAGSAGDLFLMIVTGNAAFGVSSLNGATQLYAGVFLWIGVVVISGSGSGSHSMTLDTSVKQANIGYRISGHSTTLEDHITASSGASGTSTTPDPPSCTLPSSKDWLFVACFRQAGEEANDDTWTTASPTNYTNLTQTTSGIGGAASTNCSAASAERAATTAGPENPSTFTVAQSLAWEAQTIAIAPAEAVTTPPRPMVLSQAVMRAWNY